MTCIVIFSHTIKAQGYGHALIYKEFIAGIFEDDQSILSWVDQTSNPAYFEALKTLQTRLSEEPDTTAGPEIRADAALHTQRWQLN